MSQIDGIKEELGWLKLVFGVFAAIDVSLVGWVAQNVEKTAQFSTIAAIIAVLIVTIIMVLVNRLAYRRIRELEKL